IGGLAALALGLPLTTLALAQLAEHRHIGRADLSQIQIGTMALIFAALPTFLTGGGVARLVAHRLVEAATPPATRRLGIGAVAIACGGVGTIVLTAVRIGGLPEHARDWWPLGVLGAGMGAVIGIAIALLVGLRALRHRAPA